MASDLTQKDSLRVGLIVESTRVSSYIVDLAKWGQTQNNLQVSHLIIQQTRMPSVSDLATIFFSRKRKNVREMLNLFSFSLIARFENIRLRNRQEIHKEHLRSYRVQDVVPESISIVPIAPQDDGVFRLSSADIEKLKSLDLNLLITYGPRIFHGEILNTSTFGLITLHHTDQKENTGEPAGFWEVFFRQDATGFTIEHLSEGKSSGDVLYRGHFQTQPYFLLNQACLYRKSNFFLQQIVSEIAEKGELPDALEKTPRSHRGFTHPNLGVQLIYVFRHVFDFIRKATTAAFRRKRDRWGVAFVKGDWKDLVMWRSHRISNPPNHFLADPFVIQRHGKDYCFVEDYDFQKAKGCISVYELEEKHYERLGEAIDEPFHLSFPFLFTFRDTVYMCPESSQKSDIRVYESIEFPLKWKLSKILMNNVSAADTMIFQKNNLWWMFTNIDPTASSDHNSMLYIFYAESPLSNTWLPHRMNPVIVDARKARNGGILFHDKCIYRVSQKQKFSFYGAGAAINKICVLNEDEYIETEFCRIEPKFFSNIEGSHHIHSNRNFTAFDFFSLE